MSIETIDDLCERLEIENSDLRAKLDEATHFTGPRCPLDHCPDYDGNHPFHANAREKLWQCVQQNYRGERSDMPAVVVWRAEREAARAEAADLRRQRDAAYSDGVDAAEARLDPLLMKVAWAVKVASHSLVDVGEGGREDVMRAIQDLDLTAIVAGVKS